MRHMGKENPKNRGKLNVGRASKQQGNRAEDESREQARSIIESSLDKVQEYLRWGERQKRKKDLHNELNEILSLEKKHPELWEEVLADRWKRLKGCWKTK